MVQIVKRGLCAVVAAVLSVVVLGAAAKAAVPAQLDALYSEVLRRPQDTELNLRFARAAEEAGILRWALSAYERVSVNDPGNLEAQAGLQRIRRKLQPDVSQVTLELGGGYESNPRYYIGPRRDEAIALASAILFDERAISAMRWRTTGAVTGLFYSQSNDLNYGQATLNTGPVLDILPGWAVVPAIGGTAAYYDHHFYYGEGALTTTFESATQAAIKSLQIKTAYRSYDDFFPSGSGFYTEVRGRLALPNALGAGSVLILTPWVLYSDISGTAISPVLGDIQPGAYVEYAGKVELFKSLTDRIVLGANFTAIDRRYRTDIVLQTGGKRVDTLTIPGGSLIFPHLFSYAADLRFDYRYIPDHSNDPSKSFNDHVVTGTLVYRFDPTQSFWTQALYSPAR